MIKSKEVLVAYLQKQCERIIANSEQCKKIYDYGNKNYNVPKGMMSDLVTKRLDLNKVSNFILFILLESLFRCDDSQSVDNVAQYFTMQEVKAFRNAKYEVDKIKFPIVFKMIQVADDQWIGNIDVAMLMKLRQAQLINYNVNTQRLMTKVIKGEKETYKITLNKKAVKEIQDCVSKNEFIPNAVTLNINMDTESDFYYDVDKCELVINSLEHFDILDAFHRYIALSQQYDLDNNFNYPMELRIVNWDENKAKTFIWQEDKRTPLSKNRSGANSFNMNSAANIVVTRLNEHVRSNLKGLISRGEGIINFGELADLVNYFYFKGTGKEKERTITIQAVKELTDNFNMLTEYNTDLLEHRMEWQTLVVAMFCFDYFKNKQMNPDDICKVIMEVSKIDINENKKFKNKTPRKSLMDEIKKYVEGVL